MKLIPRFILSLATGLVLLGGALFGQLPAGVQFDDGFTWLECKNYETYPGNKPVGEWVLLANVRVLGDAIPARSGWKFVVKKAGRTLAEYNADGFDVMRGGKKIGLTIVGFWRDQPRIREDGMLDVEVYYIDGRTDREHLARTCKLDVRKVATERGSVGQRDPGCDQFYVNRHSEVLSSILFFRDVENFSYTQVPSGYYSDRVVELTVNYSENEGSDNPALGRLRVEVNGKEIELMVSGNTVMQDQMGLGDLAGKFSVQHSDRAADKYFKGGPKYTERLGFARRTFVLPLHWGPKSRTNPPSKVFTNDHPGDWKITWVIDRKPVRIFRFKIGPDGLPTPHAEQGKGLTLLSGAVLVETEIPAAGAPFEGRLTNEFVKQGAFLGRPWATDAMKKLAEAVPAKGRPFPVPSDRQ